MKDVRIVPVRRVELWCEPRTWPWAKANRTAIGAHLAKVRKNQPALFNGLVYLLHEWRIDDGIFHGSMFETDVASFLAWRDDGFSDESTTYCFGVGALCSSDGTYFLGQQATPKPETCSINFAEAIPEPCDLRDEHTVEMSSCILRRLREQTGLAPDDVRLFPGWHAAITPHSVALIKLVVVPDRAPAVIARVRSFIDMQRPPELAGLVDVRESVDLKPAMPLIARAYLSDVALGRRKTIRPPVFGRA
jgi:hypothetical protein